MTQTRLIACLVTVTLAVLPLPASAWNIPAHILAAAIGYQVLRQENPQAIEKVKSVLEKHSWYANQWQARLQDVPVADHGIGPETKGVKSFVDRSRRRGHRFDP